MVATSGSGVFVQKIPEGDTRPRLVCGTCGFVRYDNPKIVVGSVIAFEDRILLCRRAIDPRSGFWTLPAGYLELNETVLEGAAREADEEANARIEIDRLLAVYSIPRISQVQLIFRARLLSAEIRPGPESVEVGLFRWDDIPWAEIAFPSARWALHHYRESEGIADFPPHGNPPGDFGNY